MLKNSRVEWGRVSRTIHWTFLIFIAAEVVVGFVMSRTYASREPSIVALHHAASIFHHTTGLLLLLAVAGRLAWRLSGPTPAPPPTLNTPMRGVAAGTHWLLYALLFLIPLSGWASLSALADSERFGHTQIWIFGIDGFAHGFPRIVPAVDWQSKSFFAYSGMAKSHRWLLIAGAGLLTLHALAALFHHVVLKDDVLRRMLGAGPSKGP